MDSNSCACYVCLYSFYASKLSDKIISKDQWKEQFKELLEVDCDIVGFRVRLNKFCLLMKKDVMKSNINLKRNIDQMNRYVTPYDNIFDNAVSITEFDLSLNSYFQKMKTGNFEYNLNEHESNIKKMNKLML